MSLKIAFPATRVFLFVPFVFFLFGLQITEVPGNVQSEGSAEKLIGSYLRKARTCGRVLEFEGVQQVLPVERYLQISVPKAFGTEICKYRSTGRTC